MDGPIHGAPALETPVPLVDLDRFESNLDRMAAYARLHRLALRPHAKTHKSPRVGAEQLRRGAVGLTCATLLEVEVMAEVADSILLAYPPVGPSKLERLMELPAGLDLTVALDSLTVAKRLAAAGREPGRTIGVLLELDLGLRRVGIAAIEDVLALARSVAGISGLEYRGITFYPGHIRGPVSGHTAELDRLRTALQGVIGALRRAGLEPKVVSGGSTPTAWRTHEIDDVTEMRPGTYVYNDRTTAQIGACDWSDCALTVLATVVSTAVPGQAVIDAGSKALGREPAEGDGDGFGALLDRPEVTVQRLSEEHAVLALGKSDWRPAVGDLVRVVPNHACIVVHLHEVIYGIRGDRIDTSWPVLARGRRPVRPPAGQGSRV
ncbi:MAG: alanine racemase [Gemmatimonadales bacterium]